MNKIELSELVTALAKGGFMMTESHRLDGYPQARKLVIGFDNGDDADNAMQAIASALRGITPRVNRNRS